MLAKVGEIPKLYSINLLEIIDETEAMKIKENSEIDKDIFTKLFGSNYDAEVANTHGNYNSIIDRIFELLFENYGFITLEELDGGSPDTQTERIAKIIIDALAKIKKNNVGFITKDDLNNNDDSGVMGSRDINRIFNQYASEADKLFPNDLVNIMIKTEADKIEITKDFKINKTRFTELFGSNYDVRNSSTPTLLIERIFDLLFENYGFITLEELKGVPKAITEEPVPSGTDYKLELSTKIINALDKNDDGSNGNGQVEAEQIFGSTINEGDEAVQKFNYLAQDRNLDANELQNIFIDSFNKGEYDEITLVDFKMLSEKTKEEYESLATAIYNKLFERYGTSDQDLKLADIQKPPKTASTGATSGSGSASDSDSDDDLSSNLSITIINALGKNNDGSNGNGQVNAEQIFGNSNPDNALKDTFDDLADTDGNLDAEELKPIFEKINGESFTQIKEDVGKFLNYVKEKYKPLANAIYNKLLYRYDKDQQSTLTFEQIQQKPMMESMATMKENDRKQKALRAWESSGCQELGVKLGKFNIREKEETGDVAISLGDGHDSDSDIDLGGGGRKYKKRKGKINTKRNTRNQSTRRARNTSNRRVRNQSTRRARNTSNRRVRNQSTRRVRNQSTRRARRARNQSTNNNRRVRNQSNRRVRNQNQRTLNKRQKNQNNRFRSKRRVRNQINRSLRKK